MIQHGRHGTDGRAGETYPPTPPGSVVRFGATIVAAASVLVGKVLIAAGLRRAHEGWRRTVGILLRSESTRFALSAFGLRVPPQPAPGASLQERTSAALLSFLDGEPDAHFRLEWRRAVTIRHAIPFVDVVVLTFDRDGILESLTPYLSSKGATSPPAEIAGRVHAAIVAAYNSTARLPEVTRTRRLLADMRAALRSDSGTATEGAWQYAERLLAASCLSFERVDRRDAKSRFRPPAFSRRRTLGFGFLSWVARPDDENGSVDLWVSAQHVGLDGVPLQDLLNRLEQAWGAAQNVVFPPAMSGAFLGPEACHAPGEREVDQLLTFVDFSPVIALRRKLNERYGSRIGGEATFGALLGWLLSQEPEFTGARIASTVDIPASQGYARDVDVVSLRPADYRKDGDPWSGFPEYAREFNRLIVAARNRTSPVRVDMQTAGLIPAWAHATLVRANPAAVDNTFGTLCVTIIRDARVFVAPMTDLGLGHGFFAVGSTNLPTASGGRVAAVTVKGESGRVNAYPAVLQRVIERAAALSTTVCA